MIFNGLRRQAGPGLGFTRINNLISNIRLAEAGPMNPSL